MVNFAALVREQWVYILVPIGFAVGLFLDKQQDQKLTAFRNKSALYSRKDYETFKTRIAEHRSNIRTQDQHSPVGMHLKGTAVSVP